MNYQIDGLTLALSCVLALVIWRLYRTNLNTPFVFDEITVLSNDNLTAQFDPVLARTARAPVWYQRYPMNRMLTWLTYEHDLRRSGVEPYAYRLTNIQIHMVNSVLLHWLLALHTSPVAAIFGAALYAVHPMQTGAVCYIAARSSMLIVTCALTMLIGADGLQVGGLSYQHLTLIVNLALTVVPIVAAKFIKEEWVVLPALLGVYLWVF